MTQLKETIKEQMGEIIVQKDVFRELKGEITGRKEVIKELKGEIKMRRSSNLSLRSTPPLVLESFHLLSPYFKPPHLMSFPTHTEKRSEIEGRGGGVERDHSHSVTCTITVLDNRTSLLLGRWKGITLIL
jgi:hypothetical protein